MTTLVALLLQHWRIVLIGLVTAFALAQSQRLTMTQKDLALLEAKTEQARIVAEAYTAESEKNLETLRTSIPLMVESAEKNAVRNYKARYSTRPVACGTGVAVSVLPSGNTSGIDPAVSTPSNDATPDQRLATEAFITDCARDAGTVLLWQEWAKLNKIPVK